MKVSELTGADLDYWVAMCAGFDPIMQEPPTCPVRRVLINKWLDIDGTFVSVPLWDFRPSKDWSQGGQIIEREQIVLIPAPWWRHERGDTLWTACKGEYFDTIYSMERPQEGESPLIAAMRACVASKYGDEVSQPPAKD